MRLAPNVEAVWLYGSHARGEAQPKSDLDVILLVRDQDTVTSPIELKRALALPQIPDAAVYTRSGIRST